MTGNPLRRRRLQFWLSRVAVGGSQPDVFLPQPDPLRAVWEAEDSPAEPEGILPDPELAIWEIE